MKTITHNPYILIIFVPFLQNENDPEVVQYYKQLADEGDINACLTLGRIYISGNRLMGQDYDMGFKYLGLAADSGSVSASGHLGYLLAQGLGSADIRAKYDENRIVELLKFASRRGDSYGVLGWGYIYMKGIGVVRNETKAFEIFVKASNKHPDAAFYLGEMLVGTGGLPKYHTLNSHDPNKQFVTPGTTNDDGDNDGENRHAEIHDARREAKMARKQAIKDKLKAKLEERMGRRKDQKHDHKKHIETSNEDKRAKKRKSKENKGTKSKKAASVEYKQNPEYGTAAQMYANAAQRGHVIALHRLSHLSKVGLGVQSACTTGE